MGIKEDYNNEYQDNFYTENLNWKRNDIAKLYTYENHNWTWKECHKKAREVYKELKKINGKMFRNDKKFFKMNKPFTFFDTKDDEFADSYHDWNS